MSETAVYVPAPGTSLEDVDAALVESESVNDVVTEPLIAAESQLSPPRKHVEDEDDYWFVDDIETSNVVHVDDVSNNDDVDVDILSGDDGTIEEGQSGVSVQDHVAIDITDDGDNPFIEAYYGSIRPVGDIITGQWKECIWDNKNLNIEAPPTNEEVWLISNPLTLIVDALYYFYG